MKSNLEEREKNKVFRKYSHTLPLFLPLCPHHTLTFSFFFVFGWWYGGPRCCISLANGEEKGAGLVCTPDAPSFKNASAPVSNSATQLTWEGAAARLSSITHTWGREEPDSLKNQLFILSPVRVNAVEVFKKSSERASTMLELNKAALLLCFLATVALVQGKRRPMIQHHSHIQMLLIQSS